MDKLTSPRRIEQLLKKYDFRMVKRFGQNFLIDENIVLKIIKAAGITKEDTVLEIGPGIGTMTQYLCEQAGHVLSVEIDKKLIPILKETMKGHDNFTLVNEDIMKIDLNQYIGELPKDRFKVVANLPYYITTPIIMGLLEKDLPVESITVMIQKEVAERIAASPGGKDYGALTVACGFYTEPKISFIVPANVFMPRPKVDSAVVHMKVREAVSMGEKDKKLFFSVVKASFANRRKTLLNTLSTNLDYDKETIRKALNNAGIDEIRRGETLSMDEFKKLAEEFKKFEPQ
ncbi:MAG: 16S rRNA (adenine(1518)-N(6)/adenine(1519)-N(6))-dimethyltransferase RsmA [Eubacteriaceae bacterium]|nr:16S rRNA (adenine(1518)-N(6)/adenine(1519)-N(6))-dimethyltransferase RsmA [Eubacteriaceae bacterium]